MFLTRHGAPAFHGGRKLFAYSFLLYIAPLCFNSTGNYSRMVSYPAWHHCVSPSQETFRIWFLIRHGTIAFQPRQETFMNLSKFPFYLV